MEQHTVVQATAALAAVAYLRFIYKDAERSHGQLFALKFVIGLLVALLVVLFVINRPSDGEQLECGPETFEPPYGVTADCWPK